MPMLNVVEARFIPSSIADKFLKLGYIDFDLQIGLGIELDMLAYDAAASKDVEAEKVYSKFIFTEKGLQHFEEMRPYLDPVCVQQLRRYRFISPKV